MINVYTYVTNSYLRLARAILLPTFHKCHDGLIMKVIGDSEEAKKDLAGATDNSEFKAMMMRRLLEYLRILKTHEGERVLFLDADVVVFRPFVSDLCSRLEDKDILHQGGGFLAFNSNEKTINFLQELCDICQNKPEDELADGFPEIELTQLLSDPSKSEWIEKLPEKYGYMSEQSFCYHAMNGGGSVLEKMYTLNLATIVDDSFKDTSSFESKESYKKFKSSKERGIICYGIETRDGITNSCNRIEVSDYQSFYAPSNMESWLNKYDDVFISLGFSWETGRNFLWSLKKEVLMVYHDKGDYCKEPKPGEHIFFGEYYEGSREE